MSDSTFLVNNYEVPDMYHNLLFILYNLICIEKGNNLKWPSFSIILWLAKIEDCQVSNEHPVFWWLIKIKHYCVYMVCFVIYSLFHNVLIINYLNNLPPLIYKDKWFLVYQTYYFGKLIILSRNNSTKLDYLLRCFKWMQI